MLEHIADLYRDVRARRTAGVERCRQHARDKLPLFLQNPAARAHAQALQEEFREDSLEESMAAEIEHWIDTPHPLSVFLGAVPHDALAGDNEPMVVPVEIWRTLGGGPVNFG